MFVAIAFMSCDVLMETLETIETDKPLTQSEIVSGLKQALTIGIKNGANKVAATDGYFKNPKIKIPFPPEVQKVEKKLRELGLGAQVDKAILSLNRAAENAAIEAKPIFVDAIKQMTISDAMGILRGSHDAATKYLKRTTSDKLRAKFKPKIDQSLNKVNATKYWTDIVNIYNKIPFIDKVNPDLGLYVTNKALDGLFVMVAIEEKKIRDNPAARITELLKRVFGYYK